MKLLFVYSAKFKKDSEGNLYTEGSINESLWERYLNISKHLYVISRLEKTEYLESIAIKKFNDFKENNKTFIAVPDMFSSIKNFLSYKVRRDVKRKIKENVLKSDYIIARFPSPEGYSAVKYAKMHNKPYLVEVVGCPKDALWNHSFKGKLIAFPNFLTMKKAVKNAPYSLYVTNEFLQSRYPSNGKSIGCSDVILPLLENNILEKRIRKIENMSSNNPIILGTTAAVDVRYKGQEDVIKAIAYLNKQGHNFEYHLVGGGDNSYLKSVSEKYGMSDKVKFLGSLPHNEVFEYLDSVDIYIQPSKLEGLPRAVIEAMSRGCPAIGSRTGGIPELLNKEFTFQSGNKKEICRLLKSLEKKHFLSEAQRSFEKAKEFERNKLDLKRNGFYKAFIERE